MSVSMQQTDTRGSEPQLCDSQAVLDVLEDKTSREIIDLLEYPKTVAELLEVLDIPQSTLYRKLDTMVAAGVIDQTIRLTSSGKHPGQYERSIRGISISFDDGFEMECQHD